MEFDSNEWVAALFKRLNDEFGKRILFVGHTGSYARGEATEGSDIDVNIVLDVLTMDDLWKYRRIISGMPFSEKACGFICGRDEMAAWPVHELFQFTQGCKIVHGSLEGIVDGPTNDDIRDSVRNLASSIYHMGCHGFLFQRDIAKGVEDLRYAYKTAFFVMQEVVYLKEHRYIPTKRELVLHIEGKDREVLETCINWDSLAEDRMDRPEHYYRSLIEWSARILRDADHCGP